MKIERVVPNLTVTDLPRAVAEHRDALEFDVLMDLGWIVTLGDNRGHQLSLLTTERAARQRSPPDEGSLLLRQFGPSSSARDGGACGALA